MTVNFLSWKLSVKKKIIKFFWEVTFLFVLKSYCKLNLWICFKEEFLIQFLFLFLPLQPSICDSLNSAYKGFFMSWVIIFLSEHSQISITHTKCIDDWDKLNLAWWFDFRHTPDLLMTELPQKIVAHF